jgi:hypothetical protein
MTRFTFQGTGQTTGGGGGGGLAVAVVLVLLLLGSGAGARAAHAAAAALIAALIALAVVLALIVVAGVAWLVYRTRQDRPGAPLSTRLVSRIPPDPRPRLEEPYKPAVERPREVHLHFHGADPQDVAAIMRRIRGDNDAALRAS